MIGCKLCVFLNRIVASVDGRQIFSFELTGPELSGFQLTFFLPLFYFLGFQLLDFLLKGFQLIGLLFGGITIFYNCVLNYWPSKLVH